MTGPRRGLRRLAASAGVLALLLSQLALAAPGRPAQAPIFAAASTQPNILIVIDDSGSMGWLRGGSKKVPMLAAQDAAIAMLESLSNVRVGVGSFYGSGAELDHEIVDLDKNRAAIYKAIRNLRASGGTPLIYTLQQMGRYFAGLGGSTNPGNSESASCTKNGQYKGPLTLRPDSNPSKADVTQVLPRSPKKKGTGESPICHFCQKNFLILLTDGWGYGNASWPLRRYCPACSHDLVSVAAGLYDIDLRPDIDDFDGKEVKNNVVTYTIGFHTSQALLKLTAEKGGGDYFEADNEEKLKEAFAKIGEDITARAVGSAAAASFSTSTLSTDTAIYLTKFDTETWTGDVVATRLDPKTAKPQKKPLWQAAEQLDKATANGRVMLTYNNLAFAGSQCPSPAKGSKTGGPVAFRWDKLSQAQQQDLLTGTGSSGGSTNFTFEKKWGSYGSGNGQFRYPPGIAVDGSGNVYVVDPLNQRVQVFDSSGNFLRKWGSRGSGDGQFYYPYGIAFHGGGACGDSVYVVDRQNHRIQKFTSNSGGGDEAMAKARLQYLRGDRSNEGKKGYKFRERESLLGDIVHSSAVHVGEPDKRRWPDGGKFPAGTDSYSAFAKKIKAKKRKGVVYVGANDGMLHGFDAKSGKELLAYLPSNLFSTVASAGYHYLTQADYQHRYYVDATPTVNDVYINKSWRSVLVGHQGAGGRGLYALDVTNPGAFSEANAKKVVLWEFNNSHDQHLGYTFAKPTIALLPNGRWAAIVGNGYEDLADDKTGGPDPAPGQAQLFIIYLDGPGSDGKWDYGRDKDYFRIPTGAGSAAERNGLSTPGVADIDIDGVVDRVYAGDVRGNLWTFDLSSDKAADWKVAHSDGKTPKPLFASGLKKSGKKQVCETKKQKYCYWKQVKTKESYQYCGPTNKTFGYTGGQQTWTVPAGVTSITVKAWGAQGGGAPATGYWGVGGKGGYSSGSASVKSGEAIYIEVGQQGFQSHPSWPRIAYNGGGDGTKHLCGNNCSTVNYTGFTGGGATHIAKVPGVLSNLAGQVSNILLVAGGGGGAGGTDRTWWSNRYIANGGHGGGWTGWGGATAASAWSYRRGGDGGTQTTRGWSPDASVAARFGRGATGRAQTSDWIQGGGGGGGYFGGGAGQQAGGGGGGGSGYIGGVTDGQTTAGNNTGNGSAQISYTFCETRYRDVYKKKWQCEMRDQKVCHSVYTYSQPITTKPEVVRGGGKKWNQEKPDTNVMVYFGTGQYLADGDNANKDTQSFYGVWDRGEGSLGRQSLLEQTVSGSGAGGRVISTDAVNWKGTGTGQHYGCYFDLPDKGERVVTDPRYRQIDGLVYFNTLIPTDPRPCAVGGTGWLMAVEAKNCGSPKSAAFDYDGDDLVGSKGDYAKLPKGKSGKEQSVGFAGKKYTAAKGTPAGVNIAGDRRFTPGSGTGEAADISSQRVQSGTGFMTKRLSWEQLFP